MTADEAREALEPIVQQMCQALLDEDEDAPPNEMALLTGWVLVTASMWPSGDVGTGSTVRIAPRENQPDHITVGLLRYAEQLIHHA